MNSDRFTVQMGELALEAFEAGFFAKMNKRGESVIILTLRPDACRARAAKRLLALNPGCSVEWRSATPRELRVKRVAGGA